MTGAHTLETPPDETMWRKLWMSRMWAVRTVLMGLLLDVTVGVTLFLVTVIGNLEWTRTYWIALGLGVAKSAIQAIVAYMVRRFLPPPQGPPR